MNRKCQPPTAYRLMSVVFCVLIVGCGSNLASISGKVTLDGKPLTRGTVVFQTNGQAMGHAEIQPDGSYRIKTGDRRGLEPGTYQVTITAYKSLPNADDPSEPIPDLLTPVRYNKPASSGLTAEVKPDSNTFDFHLKQ